ncbi:hypothetical protein Pa4123_61850 [Phytohabitans aurantiacus]|uniref:TnpV protein n=1 Tax=Phytohabitans aurantiacus TaxID=3016789 RepID=A0ABQ5R298_9ACTN|nr:hypothetical protein Pa4123_61850 [Phytohabitans aurantiacus]
MNRYGQQAMRHWQDTRPDQMRELADPEAFFTQMGEDLEQAIEDLAAKLAGDPPPQENYLPRVRRLTMARFEAEGQILRGMLLTSG